MEKIFNIYVNKFYDKYTENLQLNYFTLYDIKHELKLSLNLSKLINNLKDKIHDIINDEKSNDRLKIIKDIKTNEDFYVNCNINNKEIDNIVSKGINDNILYIFYIFNTSYFTKNMIYNNIKFDKNNTSFTDVNIIANIIYKHVILRFNDKIMVYSIDEIDSNCLNNLINNNIYLIYNNLSSYDDNRKYTIDYMYVSRLNYNISLHTPLYNNNNNINNELNIR
jgi:hypothetical protein